MIYGAKLIISIRFTARINRANAGMNPDFQSGVRNRRDRVFTFGFVTEGSQHNRAADAGKANGSVFFCDFLSFCRSCSFEERGVRNAEISALRLIKTGRNA